jgi:hypothetical protein
MIYSGPGTDLRIISGSAPKLDRIKKEVNYLNFLKCRYIPYM